MNVLGFDTATPSTAVALRLHDGTVLETRDDPPPGAHPGHATRLLAMAAALLSRAGTGWQELQRIAVGVGPGTFTGLRVGVATARGLAQSLGAEPVGVSSSLALARCAQAHEPSLTGARGAVLAVTDARRGEVFAAAYERGEDGLPRALAGPLALAPALLGDFAAAAATARAGAGDGARWLAVGDGALRYAECLPAAAIEPAPPGSPLHLVSAAAVCELGALAPAGELHALAPDYRRRPDAELALADAGRQAVLR
ncbi:MAG TPA: tRNA (adenosine(37)-N6)-threonylcarbamoyltransferase complex dimerization subunit type 1 TsaB [Solirubrobacteraceae bacterium]|nr:tRNA (adenosine(37)-N6)-threonylcarbamoyltransferase complex dimerization subunit type 1 TsaB [Solirubrobacteraceae bacterium]